MPADIAWFDAAATWKERRPGFQITYLVRGKDLVGVKHNTLRVECPFARRTESRYPEKRNGEVAYTLHEVGATVDGKYCAFAMYVDGNQFGEVETLAIKGTIVVLRSTRHEERTVKLSLANREKKAAGPFSVCLARRCLRGLRTDRRAKELVQSVLRYLFGRAEVHSPSEDARPRAITCGIWKSADISETKEGLSRIPIAFDLELSIGNGDNGDHVPLKVTGPMSNLIAVKYDVDGERHVAWNYDCSTEDFNSRTYNLPKPSSGAPLTVTLSYWTDVKESSVSFGK